MKVPWSKVFAFEDPQLYQPRSGLETGKGFPRKRTIPRRIDSNGDEQIVDAAL
jgi:hypothetical protein